MQFHPEVTHTVQGRSILERFVLGICKAQADWVMRDHIAEAVAAIRKQVGDEEVILGLSGGVDSSVAAALIHRAIGDQLTCVFVDHGLLRLDEGDMVMDMFEGRLHAKVVRVDAADLFLGKLAGVTDPEAQRKIIGREFVEVFKAEAAKIKQSHQRHVAWLAQGTIYPDVIESGGAKSKKAVTIKSHHNVGGLPEQLGLKLLEPLRDLFKDEVRKMGAVLGLPDAMVWRHPFPGPGLAVRCLGEVKKDYRRPVAPRRRHLHRGTAQLPRREERQELVRPDQPGLHGVPAGEERGRDGRRPQPTTTWWRLRGAASQRLHDGRLGGAALCAAQEGVQPHHQRGARHQPRHLRREQQAAGDDRVGVKDGGGRGRMLACTSRPSSKLDRSGRRGRPDAQACPLVSTHLDRRRGLSRPVTHLPLRADQATRGQLRPRWATAPRPNPHWRYLRKRGRGALVTFLGPHAYQSPKIYPDLQRVPSWNYLCRPLRRSRRTLVEDRGRARTQLLKKLIGGP